MYYKWYQLYSYWIAVLALLYKLKIININVYPSVLLSIIGTLYIIYLKSKNNIKMSTSYFIGIICIHLLVLLLVNRTLNFNDLLTNLLLLFFYAMVMQATTGKNIYSIYSEIVNYDTNIPFYEVLKRQFNLS